MTIRFLLTAGLLATCASAQSGSAVYELTFSSTWSAATHPVDFPSGPHFSGLVGTTHTSGVSFWNVGSLASNGMRAMAERGLRSPLWQEINPFIPAQAEQLLRATYLGGSPQTGRSEFTVSAGYPLLTLVSMLAPSPDWFVGVGGMPLVRNGFWIDDHLEQLHVYDAGTDSGTTYTSPDTPSNPPMPIARVTTTSGPFQGRPGPVASFHFRRLTSAMVFGCGVNPAGSMTVAGLPRIGQAVDVGLDDPIGSMGTPATTVLLIAVASSANSPCGISVPGFGLGGVGAPGEYLLDGPIIGALQGAAWTGAPVNVRLDVPNDANLIGDVFFAQGALIGPTARIGFTDAVELLIGG